ncbi:hypothetical protein LINPERPRIM_LOCUS7038 [Linum perenne]
MTCFGSINDFLSRIRHFLGLSGHEKLLTNAVRVRRHLTQVDSCMSCDALAESVLHVLRDCLYAHQVWTQLDISQTDPRWEACDLADWMTSVARHEDSLLAEGKPSNTSSKNPCEHPLGSWIRRVLYDPQCRRVGQLGVDKELQLGACCEICTNIVVFNVNLGSCSITRAELHGISIELKIA